jgi:hypothetical protein
VGGDAVTTRDRARVSTFILVEDDPRAIQRFGGDVTPALCEAVARERQAAGMRTKEETKTKVARKGGESYLL